MWLLQSCHLQKAHPFASWQKCGWLVFCLRCMPSTIVSHTHSVLCKFSIYNYMFLVLIFVWQGFYKSILDPKPACWEAICEQPLVLQAEYQLAASSQIIASPLLFLHFILSSIHPGGNPARLASELLTAYLPAESFLFKEIIFDLSADDLISKHTADVISFVKSLEKWVYLVQFRTILASYLSYMG